MSAKAKTKLTPQQRKATLTRVLGKIKPYSLFVVCSLVVAAVSVGAQLYIPILCGSAIDLMLGKGAGLLEKLVDEGGLAMIDVGDDGDVANGGGHGLPDVRKHQL